MCVCVYVCMRIFVYTCMCVRVCVCMYVCMYALYACIVFHVVAGIFMSGSKSLFNISSITYLPFCIAFSDKQGERAEAVRGKVAIPATFGPSM